MSCVAPSTTKPPNYIMGLCRNPPQYVQLIPVVTFLTPQRSVDSQPCQPQTVQPIALTWVQMRPSPLQYIITHLQLTSQQIPTDRTNLRGPCLDIIGPLLSILSHTQTNPQIIQAIELTSKIQDKYQWIVAQRTTLSTYNP